ncbi:cellulase family glycosylhydrolase [Actinoplanes sp. HUAS TT8]|uniref:cellulase family glycosylhydrolase n=1 Tax=Actinoplanes sp. HUAS TT8 TaxID=3447453 RepID=UPI003F51CE30
MNRRRWVTGLVAMVVAGMAGAVPAQAAGAGRVTASGTHLVRDGGYFPLYAASVYPSGSGWKDAGFRSYFDGVVADEAGAGLNTLRLTDFIKDVTTDPYDPVMWGNVDYAIQRAAANGLAVILDLSTFRNDLLRKAPTASPYLVEYWTTFLDFVGNRYRDETAIAYVALAGEPEGPKSEVSGRPASPAELTAFYQAASAELHRVAPDLLISSGGLMQLYWDSGIEWQSIFALPNILPAVHIYHDEDLPLLATVAKWTAQHDKPLILEEFGEKQSAGDATRAALFQDRYRDWYRYGLAGIGFWNFGPEVTAVSHDVNPGTPLTWATVRANAPRTASTPPGTLFRTGFESTDTQPTWSDTIDWSSSVTGMYTGITPECSVRVEKAHSGIQALMYSGKDTSAGGSFAYFKSFNVTIPVSAGTKLSYWLWPGQANGRFVGVDLHFTDGSTLRDSGAVDQRGFSMHPKAAHGGAIALSSWTQIQSDIGRWANGRTIDRIWIAYDQPAATGDFRGYVDDIEITN